MRRRTGSADQIVCPLRTIRPHAMEAFTSAGGDPNELPDLNAGLFIAGDNVRLHYQAHVLA